MHPKLSTWELKAPYPQSSSTPRRPDRPASSQSPDCKPPIPQGSWPCSTPWELPSPVLFLTCLQQPPKRVLPKESERPHGPRPCNSSVSPVGQPLSLKPLAGPGATSNLICPAEPCRPPTSLHAPHHLCLSCFHSTLSQPPRAAPSFLRGMHWSVWLDGQALPRQRMGTNPCTPMGVGELSPKDFFEAAPSPLLGPGLQHREAPALLRGEAYPWPETQGPISISPRAPPHHLRWPSPRAVTKGNGKSWHLRTARTEGKHPRDAQAL